MHGFFIRLLITTAGLWVASAIVPGMEIVGADTMLLAAILLGIVNAVIRPIIFFLTLPITVLTLGIFLIVINAAMLGLVASMLDDFSIDSFGAALLGALIVGIVSCWASWSIGPRGNIEFLIIKKY